MTQTVSNPSKELNPCPFCGGAPELIIFEDEQSPYLEPIYFVRCHECDARGPHRDDPFYAERWWNQEHLQDAIAERLEEESGHA